MQLISIIKVSKHDITAFIVFEYLEIHCSYFKGPTLD